MGWVSSRRSVVVFRIISLSTFLASISEQHLPAKTLDDMFPTVCFSVVAVAAEVVLVVVVVVSAVGVVFYTRTKAN